MLKNEVESRRPRKKGFKKPIYELKGTYKEIEKKHLKPFLERLEIRRNGEFVFPVHFKLEEKMSGKVLARISMGNLYRKILISL